MKGTWIVFCKEIKRFFTDPRMLLALYAPGIVLFIVYNLMGNITTSLGQASVSYSDTAFSVVYSNNFGLGSNHDAPYIISSYEAYLASESKGNTVQTETYTLTDLETQKERLLSGELDLVIAFSDNFDQTFMDISKQSENKISLYYDGGNEKSSYCYSFVSEMLSTVYVGYLVNIDQDGNYVNPNVSGDNYLLSEIIAFVFPMVSVSLLFSTIIAICPESVAGEKERGTLSSILLTPTKRYSIALGKVMALSLAAVTSGIVSFLGLAFSLPKLMGGDLSVAMWGFGEMALLLLLIVSALLLFLALGLVISTLCSSTKEASGYMGPVMMLLVVMAILPGLADMTSLPFAFVPGLNILSCMNMLISGVGDIWLYFLITIVENVILFGAMIALCGRLFKSERVMLKR